MWEQLGGPWGHPAPYDSDGNGDVEYAVGQAQGLLRALGVALGRSIGHNIPHAHPAVAWLEGHVACILASRRVEGNGLTS